MLSSGAVLFRKRPPQLPRRTAAAARYLRWWFMRRDAQRSVAPRRAAPAVGVHKSTSVVPKLFATRLTSTSYHLPSAAAAAAAYVGPHEGGPASYPVGNGSTGFTKVSSTLTVPAMPEKIDGITYYIWSDIFFGDMSYGRMNQFVPQLILGSALDNSSGPPDYRPMWGTHSRWAFGAHYFFEVYNATTKQQDAHAAYGELFPAKVGEELFISFSAKQGPHGPEWTLKMGAVDDPARVSVVEVPAPYMGIGKHWPVPSTSWAELNYTNMCINSCWELYGGACAAGLTPDPRPCVRALFSVAEGDTDCVSVDTPRSPCICRRRAPRQPPIERTFPAVGPGTIF